MHVQGNPIPVFFFFHELCALGKSVSCRDSCSVSMEEGFLCSQCSEGAEA